MQIGAFVVMYAPGLESSRGLGVVMYAPGLESSRGLVWVVSPWSGRSFVEGGAICVPGFVPFWCRKSNHFGVGSRATLVPGLGPFWCQVWCQVWAHFGVSIGLTFVSGLDPLWCQDWAHFCVRVGTILIAYLEVMLAAWLKLHCHPAPHC